MGLITGALAGLGEGMMKGAEFYGRHLLQKQAEEATAARDSTLMALREAADMRAEERKREPYKQAAADAESLIGKEQAKLTAPVSEEAGGVGPTAPADLQLSPAKAGRLRAGAYEKRGLIDAAGNYETLALRQEDQDLRNIESVRLSEKDRAAETRDTQQHAERMAALDRQAKQQEAQMKLEERKLGILESNNALEKQDKDIIRKARNEYMAEKDPEKKAELGEQYLTLLGKTGGDRLEAIRTADPQTGVLATTGFMDKITKKVYGTDGRLISSGQSGASPYPDGTELNGKDGKVYVVRGGAPVLKSTDAPNPAPARPPATAPAATPQSSSGAASDGEFNAMLKDAARGGSSGKKYIQELLASGNPTTPAQRQAIRDSGIKF